MKKSYQNLNLKNLLTDLGSEFFGETQEVLKKHNVSHYFANPNHEAHVAIIERLFRTLKMRIRRIMLEWKTDNWPSTLDTVMNLHNKTYSRSLGMSPNQAWLQKNWNKVWYNTFEKLEGKLLARNSKKPFVFSIGDTVRLQFFKRNKFQKESEPTFSEFLYRVLERKREAGIPMYKVAELLTSHPVEGFLYEKELEGVPMTFKSLKQIHAIHGSRITKQQTEVEVSFPETPKKKKWMFYSDLLGI